MRCLVPLLVVLVFLAGCSAAPEVVAEPEVAPAAPVVSPPAAPAEETETEPAEAPQSVLVEPPSPEALLEAALESYESSRVFWDEGDLESALAALDHAYAMMLDVPDDNGPLVAQQRDDLRRLISRRIVEIYASRQTATGTIEVTLAPLEGEAVDREVRSFQTRERESFLVSYRRSGRYRPFILEQLREAGLPEQLSWLPLIESSFKTRARSSAAAVGLWQFIASTGYRFGLERDSWVDERMDPEKSTDAAIAYLRELHGLFGDWATALAAYNCGEHRVLRLIRSQRVDYLDHFWDLYDRLPRETRRYVPRFFATLRILEDPAAYGFELPTPDAPVPSRKIEVGRSVQLATLDARLGLAKGTLRDLNPELRRDVTPRRSYELRVPASGVEAAQLQGVVASIKEAPVPSADGGYHRVRSGETLSAIAARYGTSSRTLQSINGLRSAHRIYPGQRLRLPSGARGSSAPPASGEHRVSRGETLSGIAARYGTTARRLQDLNGLKSANRIYPGQTLRISDTAPGTGERTTYTVRRGDSLWKLAQRYGTTVGRIQRDNGLRGTSLQIGQKLVIAR